MKGRASCEPLQTQQGVGLAMQEHGVITVTLIPLIPKRAVRQTISLSGMLITPIREEKKGVLGRENTFVCFLHAEKMGSMSLWDGSRGDQSAASLKQHRDHF